MHLEPPKDFPIECAMELAKAARDGTVFDNPRQSFIHAMNLLFWGGGTFIPEEGFTANFGSTPHDLSSEQQEALQDLKAAFDSNEPAPPNVEAGPLQDFFATALVQLLALLDRWLGDLLSQEG